MKFTEEGVDRSVDKLLTACYDVTRKLYQHHGMKRVTHTVDMCWILIMYLMYFVVVMLLFQLLAKHSSAALPCKRFVNKRLFIIAASHPNC